MRLSSSQIVISIRWTSPSASRFSGKRLSGLWRKRYDDVGHDGNDDDDYVVHVHDGNNDFSYDENDDYGNDD